MSEDKKFRLFDSARFIFSGSKDCVRSYLRSILDRWEVAYGAEETRKLFARGFEKAVETKEEYIDELKDQRRDAYNAFSFEMSRDWYVTWNENETIKKRDALSFFLE